MRSTGSIPGTRICIVVHVAWKQSAKLLAVGSIPTRCFGRIEMGSAENEDICMYSQVVWQRAFNPYIAGSSPVTCILVLRLSGYDDGISLQSCPDKSLRGHMVLWLKVKEDYFS